MRTGQEEGFVHCVFLDETDMAEVLLALADGTDGTALIEDLRNDLLCGVLRKTPDKHRFTTRGSFSRGWRRQICNRERTDGLYRVSRFSGHVLVYRVNRSSLI